VPIKASKFTETQIVSIFKQSGAGVPVKDVALHRSGWGTSTSGDERYRVVHLTGGLARS
jgi:hypothetical protein